MKRTNFSGGNVNNPYKPFFKWWMQQNWKVRIFVYYLTMGLIYIIFRGISIMTGGNSRWFS